MKNKPSNQHQNQHAAIPAKSPSWSTSSQPLSSNESPPSENDLPSQWHWSNLLETGKNTTIIKTTIINHGDTYDHVAYMISKAAYCMLTNNNTFNWAYPVDPGSYSLHITNQTTDIQWAKHEATHKIRREDYENYLSIKEALKDKMIEAADETWLKALKRPIIGFATCTAYYMLNHLWTHVMMVEIYQWAKMEYFLKLD